PPDRRAIDRIDGSELREINRTELGGGLEAVELQNRRWIDSVFEDVRKIRERLDNMEKSIQTKRTTLRIFVGAGNLERSFGAGVENSAQAGPRFDERVR